MKKKILYKFAVMALIFSVTQVKASNNTFYSFLIDAAVSSLVNNSTQSTYAPSKADSCIGDTKNIGDPIDSPAGNSAKVINIIGPSPKCTNPLTPILAELEFHFSFSSKAGIELSDDYEVKPLASVQRFNGQLILANSKSIKNKGLVVNARKRKPNADFLAIANAISTAQASNLKDSTIANAKQLKINGMNAAQFEVTGTLKGLFGVQMTYFVTVLDGNDEILVVAEYAPADIFEKTKPEFMQMLLSIRGIGDVGAPPPDVNQATVANNPSNSMGKLDQLDAMRKKGLITQKEFDAKKAEILKNL